MLTRFSHDHRLRPAGRMLVGVLVLILACAGGAFARTGDRAPYGRLDAKRWDPSLIRSSEAGRRALAREQVREGESSRRWLAVHELLGGRQVSRKSAALLRSRNLGPALLASGMEQGPSKSAQDYHDTLRVLIVRVSFLTNRDSSLTTIAPDGDFVLEPPVDPGPLEIDPPPHDKAFYESHLTGLSQFYDYQSGGRLHIEGRVLPEDPNGSYKVGDVADYGPGAGGFWKLEDLERLVRDMMVAADAGTQADGSANLADYDDDNPFSYIIFVHAGSDWQSDINGDSPNDIPTFFMTLAEPQPLTSIDTETGSVGMLSECSIIPETTNQDDYPGSIAAAFYHEFGHALGLVDIYNTDTMTPNAGIWDLMDSGTNLGVNIGTVTAEGDTVFVVANGVLPPSLGAWNKWYLGWLDLGEVQGTNLVYRLPAVEVPRDQYEIYDGISGDFDLRYAQGLRAGISPREWFLLENRWVPSGPAETPYQNLSFERDEATGVILYLAGERPQGFWQNSGLYDYFLPAGGVLVWHVNEDRIERGLATNTINTQGDGLRLVEADGITDIGILDAYVLGWYGSARDPFGGYDSEGFTSDYNDLYTDGFPSSRCVDRSWSGFFLSDVRPNTGTRYAVMRFGAGIKPVTDGFPVTLPQLVPGMAQPLDVNSLTPLVLPDGRSMVVFAAADSAAAGDSPYHLHALNPSGFPVWPGQADGPGGPFATLPGALAGSPVAVTTQAEETALLWSTVNGDVGLTVLGNATREAWVQHCETGLGTGAVMVGAQTAEPFVLVITTDGRAIALDPETGLQRGSALLLEPDSVSGAVLVRGDATAATALVPFGSGWFDIRFDQQTGSLTGEFHAYPGGSSSGHVWGGWLTNGDAERLHFFGEDGQLGTWQRVGDQWVPTGGLDLDRPPVCEPAVADLDGDGRDDLILATADMLHAFSFNGVPLRGWPVKLVDLFPLPDSTRISGPLVVADGTGDGVDDVYFNTDGGHLLGLDALGNLLAGFPFRWGDKAEAGLAVGNGYDPAGPRILWLASRGGYAGPPFDRNLVNGRITGYNLAAVSTRSRTSEWLGTGGGSRRMGPQGSPADLGELGPAAGEVDTALLYPNPLGRSPLTVRFFSADTRAARFWIHNLEGEVVYGTEIPAVAGTMNEMLVDLPDLASGLYVCRLEFSASGGRILRTMTLAVER